jgi:hypothetical protein
MSQKDMVLKLPLCNLLFITTQCESPAVHMFTMELGTTGEFKNYATIEGEDGIPRFQKLCEIAVPGACPRIQCFSVTEGEFLPCRMQALIQGQVDGSEFWSKLPCSVCEEKRKLHPTTEGFVYGEDTGGS